MGPFGRPQASACARTSKRRGAAAQDPCANLLFTETVLAHLLIHPLIHFVLPRGAPTRWYHALWGGFLVVILILAPLLGALALAMESTMGLVDALLAGTLALCAALALRRRLKAAAVRPAHAG